MPDPFVFPLPMDQNPRPPLGETDYRESNTLNPDILVEIKRVLGLWKKDGGGTKSEAQDSNTAVDDTTTSVDERNLNFRKSVQRSLSKLLPQIPPLGEFGIGLRDIMPWVIPARSMFIQLWSEMVHHNVTFGELSSHNHSFIAERIREFGQARIGPFREVTQAGHLLIKAMDLITAFEDAMARFRTHTSMGVPVWKDDSAFGVTENDIISRAAAIKANRRKRIFAASAPRRDDNDEGGGQGGGSGGDPSGSGSGSSRNPPGGNAGSGGTKRRYEPSNDGSDRKLRARKHVDIVLRDLHLAFTCIEEQLFSHGFSTYERLVVPSRVHSPRSVSFPQFPEPGFSTPPQTPPMHHRTPSVASTASTGVSGFSSPGGPPSRQSSHASVSTVFTTPESSPAAKGAQRSAQPGQQGPRRTIPSKPMISKAGVVLDHKIYKSAIGIVWGGLLLLEDMPAEVKSSSNGISEADTVPIVVKLTEWDTRADTPTGTETDEGKYLRREAFIYEGMIEKVKVDRLHAEIDLDALVPYYYGLFNDSGSLALLLEDSGDRLPFKDWKDSNDLNLKQEVYNKVVILHQLGVQHGDLMPRNVVVDEARARRYARNWCLSVKRSGFQSKGVNDSCGLYF
ncbi:hypothetical protein DFH05DRAFT_1528600 [Lentinula detonsa]|uniref:Protein kinase domain-containing protein n=1 Tax=Lentinula detonsa TaxID=2804962 RepID=A0A9W8NTW7_9AGAR|nr:hypothetical protein DFH05DRAFT_1528600 [Lentinula detonsa]